MITIDLEHHHYLQTWQTCRGRRKQWSRPSSSQLPRPPPSSPPRSLAAASSTSSWSCSRWCRWWWWWWCCCHWSNQGALVGHGAKPQSDGRSVSFPEAKREREREREGKTEGNSRSSFRVFIAPRIRVHTYTAPYWRRCGAYCFLLVLLWWLPFFIGAFMVVGMLQFLFLLQNQNPLLQFTCKSSHLLIYSDL